MPEATLSRPHAAPPSAPRLPFGMFLALRYLKPRRTFVSIITLISILGVTLGIAVLIVVISVMTGFDRELRSKVLGFDPHIEVTNGGLIEDWRIVRTEINKTPGVVASSPYVMGPVLAEANNRRVAPTIRGVDPALERDVIDLGGLMGKGSRGRFDLDGDKAVVGVDLAKLLGVEVGDKLTIYSPHALQSLADELEKLKGKPADEKKIAGTAGVGCARGCHGHQASSTAGVTSTIRSSFSCRSISRRNSTNWRARYTGSRSRRSMHIRRIACGTRSCSASSHR